METTETKPVTCGTCLYMATHDNCKGCLPKDGAPLSDDYLYLNHRFGNWLGRQMWFEYTGKHSIVIGGQGEAEVNVNRKPLEVSKNLHYVAEQCGFYVHGIKHAGRATMLVVSLPHGSFRLIGEYPQADLDAVGERSASQLPPPPLSRIAYLDHEGNSTGNYWSRDYTERVLAKFDKSDDECVRNYKS